MFWNPISARPSSTVLTFVWLTQGLSENICIDTCSGGMSTRSSDGSSACAGRTAPAASITPAVIAALALAPARFLGRSFEREFKPTSIVAPIWLFLDTDQH